MQAKKETPEQKINRIRNLCKLCPQYIPLLDLYDKGEINREDFFYRFALMEIDRQTKGFSFGNNRGPIQATDHHEKTVDEKKDDT